MRKMENVNKKSGMWSAEFDEKGDLAQVQWSQSYRNVLGFTDETDFPNEMEAWISRIYPEDRKSVLGAHRSALRGADRYEMEYRILTKKDGYCWIKDCGEVMRREDGTLHSYMGYITYVGKRREDNWEYREEQVFKKALEEAQGELEKQNEILSALCSDYITIYRVNLDTEEYETLLAKDELRGNITNLIQSDRSYSDTIDEYIDTCIREDDAEYVRRKTRKEYVLKELENKSKFYIRYHVKDNPENVENFEVHFAKVSYASADKIVIVGFRNIDDILKEREEERLATQRDIEETLEGARTGLWALECDAEGNKYLYADRTMKYLLGVSQGATPEECYHTWVKGVEEGYLSQATEAITEMRENGRSEVIYPWNHPKLGQIYIRCGGVKDEKYDKPGYRVKGYHQDVTETMVIRKKRVNHFFRGIAAT